MKKAIIYTFLILVLAFASANTIMAQPHPGEQAGGSGDPVQGAPIGAPVGNGTFILLTLAMAYAGLKVYAGNKTVDEESE